MSTDPQNTQYLDPGIEKKYPYKKDGRISANLLKAAIVRSAQAGDKAINMKARELFDDHCV